LDEQVPETPAWLAELRPSAAPPADVSVPVFEGQVPPALPEIEAVEAAGLARAEIPDWLEVIRPKEKAAEVAEEGPMETAGLLEGLRGVIPSSPAIEMPTIRESARPAEAHEASLARAQLLQELLAQEQTRTPQPEAHKAGLAMGERLQRLIVALALILPMLTIILWHPLTGNEAPLLTYPDQLDREALALYNTIESMNAGDAVLVAFEYGPAEADELDMVAEPILQHLVDRGVHITPVSTQPIGPSVAEKLLSPIGAIREQPAYRPGDATGVSQLLAGAGSPKLILVLTARPASLRWWVEQAHARGQTVVAGVSAATEIIASPYLDTNANQLRGAISGLSGAAAYENYRETGEQAAKQLNALAAGRATVAILMLAGGVIYTIVRPRGEEG